MSATTRRVLGVVLAVLALAGGTVAFSSQRATQLKAASVQAQAEVDAELPKVAASLEGLTQEVARAAERGANLEAIGGLLSEITSQADLEPLAKTFEAFETEPFFAPFVKVGPHAFFLGATPLFSTEPALVPKLQTLAATATTAGTATAIVTHGGAVWLVGVSRSQKTNPQQQPIVFALAEKLTPVRLDGLASKHGAAVLVVPDGKSIDAVGGGSKEFVDVLRHRLTSMKLLTEPCCAQKELAPGVQLLVHRDPAARLHAATAEASKAAAPIYGVAGLLALGALVFGFRPQRKPQNDEHAELLRQTAAQLKASQEQLQRLSQRIETASTTDRFAGGAPGPTDDGLGSTQATVQQSRYEVVAPLGEGGMARVAVAVVRGAEGFRRTFVVKRLRPELSNNPEVVSQFIDEARLGASLVHSNIIPVFDFGRDAEGYYLAQEYILGRDVDALITASREQRQRALEPEVVLYIAQEALKALGYAHTRANDAGKAMGLVHRDVSPNNLMVSARGEVKLLDFGIVKSDDRTTRTQAGVVKGNLFFMSPEQARALPVDPRSDLFSLGMVLVSALTGETLYSGDNVYDLMTRAAAGPTDADRERVKRECGALADVVLKALSVDPASRFPDAEAFGKALAAVGPAATSAQLQALVETLFATQFAEERQKFAVSA
ncbi:MAG: serine/threonine-protein kinase [Archangium sp.]|nr:serine/threonine-protein kinase [Archangium sp.]